jgi:hypothetical protein
LQLIVQPSRLQGSNHLRNVFLKGGELSMPKYLVRVAIPTVYVIDAPDEQEAMHQAAKRFKHDQNTWLEPEVSWSELEGTDSTAIWRIAE